MDSVATTRPTAGAGSSASASPRTAAAVRPRVIFIGTSLTAGYGLDPDDAYPAMLQRRIDSLGLGYAVTNVAESGQTSAGALTQVQWMMRHPDGRPRDGDIVVVETGANDGLRGLPVAAMRANIQAILDSVKAAAPRARVLLVGMEAPPNLGAGYTRDFHEAFPELARKNNATLLPFLLDKVAGHAELNQGDGIHPNLAGERIVAETVWGALRPLLQR